MKPITFMCDFCKKKGSEVLIKEHELVCPKNPGHQVRGKRPRRDRQDLTGKIFGYLTVVSPYYNEVDTKHSLWACECKCGNTCIKRQEALFATPVPSCGCHKKEATSKQWSAKLDGKRFGKLQVISRVKTKKKRALWKCRCDCGEICYYPSRYLLSMGVISCGCETKSKGELRIRKILQKHEYLFKEQFAFNDCRGDERSLRFDFAVLDERGHAKCLIEINGAQHYQAIRFFGGEEYLSRQKRYDKIKCDYCRRKGLNLIVFNCEKLDNMTDKEVMRAIVEHCPWMSEARSPFYGKFEITDEIDKIIDEPSVEIV